MGDVLRRYTPADPRPRVLLAFLLTVIPVTLTMFGASVVANAYANWEALHSVPGLAMVVLAVSALVATHISHVILRDVAEAATADTGESEERVPDQRGATERDPAAESRQRRYANDGLSDREFDRMIDELGESPGQGAEPTDRVRE